MIVKTRKKSNKIICRNNAVLNSVLHNKVRVCEAEEIPVMLHIQSLEPGSIHEIDMLSILYNIFDNAVEACRQVDKDKRFIEFGSGQVANQLVIKIRNRIKDCSVREKGKRFLTGKKDKRQHGFEMQIVEDIVNKYYGALSIQIKEDIFELVITLENDQNGKDI